MPPNPKDIVGSTKPPIELIPPAGIIHTALAMGNGGAKYGPYNFRDKKIQSMIYIGAAMRHLLAFLDGEDYAKDSGVHHLGHAAACCMILLDALECNNIIDNRPSKGVAADLIEKFTVKTNPQLQMGEKS